MFGLRLCATLSRREKTLTKHKSVFISDYRAEWERLKAYSQTEEFTQDMKQRPHIERIIAGLVLHNDARRARFRGLAKVDFQLKMCGMAFNVKRWLVKLSGQRRAKRRRFNAPMPSRRPFMGEVGLMST
jgi:hypothetical protein